MNKEEISQGDREANINYRIQRAYETLNDVELLISNGSFHSGISRLYYACFYSVLAYLLKIGLSPKSHTGTKQLFGMHVVKKGLIPKELGGFFADIMTLRITGDYDEFVTIYPEEAKEMFETGKIFINHMSNLVLGKTLE